MIPTPIDGQNMAEELLEEKPTEEVAEEKAKPKDCGNKKCHRYRFCWACKHWFGCKRKAAGNVF